jgi:hypothetical protein
MQPPAAICRWSRDIRGMDLEAFPRVNSRKTEGNLLRHQGQRPGSCPGMGGVVDHPACCRRFYSPPGNCRMLSIP